MRTITIRGFVRSAETDMGLYRARVELHSFTGGQVGSMQVTNQEGEFTFLSVPPGNYDVSAEADGYAPGRQSLQLSEAFGSGGLVIFLKRLEASAPGAPGGSVSAKELGLPPKVKKDYEDGLEALYQKHKPEASLTLFARVIAKVPEFYQAYHHSGMAYARLGRSQEAETAFRKALELSQGRAVETQIALASVLSTENNFTEAETLARNSLKTSPGNWLANYELARALVGLKRPDEAEKEVQESLKVKPDQPEAYLLLANIHMNRNDSASLIKDLDNFLRLEPKGPQSDKARKMREQTQKELAQAKAATGSSPPPH